ncbi:MAG: caspase family protein [Candidatus Obscuribacterales bacterium]|nr:caspase family protein [Candidatus Obscuribacterales bacterium]
MSTQKRALTMSKEAAEEQFKKNTNSFAKLSSEFEQRVQQHLQLAGTYDFETFRKNDDELNGLFDRMDATYLDMRIMAEHLGLSTSYAETLKDSLQKSKMFMYKSSSIFYLCFGRPLQSAQCAKLSLSLAQCRADQKLYESEMYFYLGSAYCWAGDYKAAEENLQRALEPVRNRPATQVKPGESVDIAGHNPFASHYLGSVYIAEKNNSKAIDLLTSTREKASGDEVRGNADALLALAYSLENKKELAQRHIRFAQKSLDNKAGQVFPSLAKESLGIVAALQGNYQLAERKLTEALPGLQDSPLNLGNRLEAAQASLWRSYCRDKLGNKAGAQEDRQYAMNFADEAPHLMTVSHLLDKLFAKKQVAQAGERVGDKWAIVVGIGNFSDPGVPKLLYSKKDVDDITDFLLKKAGFKPDHVKTLLDSNATKTNLIECLSGSWLPGVTKPGDVVFLFITTHGTPTYKEIGAMNSVVTYDTKLDQLFETSIPMQSIVRMLRSNLNKRHTFVVLDACYAGGLGAPGKEALSSANVNPDLLLNSNYQLLLSSSEDTERSWESKRYKNSIFTRQLIDALERCPRYEDFHSLFCEIRKKVFEEVSADYKGITQTPKLSGLWSGKGLMSPEGLVRQTTR